MSLSLYLEDRGFPKSGIRLPLFGWIVLEKLTGMSGLAVFFCTVRLSCCTVRLPC